MIQSIPKEVNLLAKSSYTFWLTGSRFFGESNAWSDWDFFAEDTEELRQYLLNMGFDMVETESYKGDSLKPEIFVLNPDRGPKQIHIQLYKNIIVKVKAQKIFSFLKLHYNYISRRDKEESSSMLWAIAYSVVQMTLEDEEK